jgi:phosphatidylinositol-3,4,5-trisphosphate 3-phosphatase/dual-specificity protein phosphatase PTEN
MVVEGFNLDLTYITNRIIACGFPAEGFEGLYRNKKEDLINFFRMHHGTMLKIYNLCAEKSYAYD